MVRLLTPAAFASWPMLTIPAPSSLTFVMSAFPVPASAYHDQLAVITDSSWPDTQRVRLWPRKRSTRAMARAGPRGSLEVHGNVRRRGDRCVTDGRGTAVSWRLPGG